MRDSDSGLPLPFFGDTCMPFDLDRETWNAERNWASPV
jgi:hypothetical protein